MLIFFFKKNIYLNQIYLDLHLRGELQKFYVNLNDRHQHLYRLDWCIQLKHSYLLGLKKKIFLFIFIINNIDSLFKFYVYKFLK
jgi:hypothetical protein